MPGPAPNRIVSIEKSIHICGLQNGDPKASWYCLSASSRDSWQMWRVTGVDSFCKASQPVVW